MAKILVIAPYQGFKDLFLEVSEELDSDIHVEVGDLYKGLALAQKLESEGYEVIISRGATALLLREHCKLPVVEVKVSGYDIMRTLTLVKGYPGKIGLMSYLNIIQGADVIGDLLDMNLTFFPIQEEREVESRIREAIGQGIEVIIGDVISTSIAAQHGINSILITSGKEAVLESIRDAEHLSYYVKKEKASREMFAALVDSCREGIVAVDSEGKIYAFNRKAEEFFSQKAAEVSGRKAGEVDPHLNFESILTLGHREEEVVTLNGEEVVVSKQPISLRGGNGAVAFLQTLRKLQRVESRIRNRLADSGYKARMHFNHLVHKSPRMQETVKIAKQYSRNDLPILIYGEPGTGKTSIAEAIHNASDRHEFPFVFLNCEAYKEEQLECELFGYEGNRVKPGVFELADGGTLFIDEIGKMPITLQAKLIHVLEEKKLMRVKGKSSFQFDVRLIAANGKSLQDSVVKGEFREDLYHLMNQGTLSIPPLRDRKEDLEELARWFIASFNPILGKQIVGIRPEVMSRLKESNWPGNVQELKNVVRKMCIAAKEHFIREEDVRSILDELSFEKEGVHSDVALDIAGKTLEQIEKEIISRVLAEEDYNQSKAAKRLGINRSTLWRKIKETE
ncbi:PrpR N-terminal domain-containing protein [Effusibacillus dendaii]|uniref:Sigma-54-dependent Fis family transcriptional regulator n=1 Tax=Effusibacillus dendaii TaxID=2743772 RepID=A0A7I8DCM5_9BACL|nr:PrpR N-terminal domain-containing protein [Effusibacillus dendaii]BCJ86270.1 sigma-54-dependent Fis family transcriptional regulator [Effusibacillus dendaii]